MSGYLPGCAAFLLAATAWPAGSASSPGLVPQHSEDLRPALTPASKAGGTTLEFTAFGRAFRLQLSRNAAFAKLAAGSALQIYKGSIEGVPGSWARITMQDGLPRGMIWDGREMFVVDAPPEGVNDGAAGTVMFKLSDAVLERGISLADDVVGPPRDAGKAYGSLLGELRARTEAAQGVPTQKLEISVLADAAVLARFASQTQARDAILTRLNNVDGIFSSQLGVEISVESVEIAGELTAALSATTHPSTLLEELGELRGRTATLRATGLTHLFTGRDLDGDTAGMAYTLALCSPRFASSHTTFHSSAALDTLMTAHEIGHVFGAPHDGVQECAATPQGQYIMTPMLDTSVTSFSQCSLDQINAVIDSYSCLEDLPAAATPSPPPGDAGDGGGGEGGGGSVDTWVLGLLLMLALSQWLPRRHRRR
jgi:hypothetical protein